MSENGDALGDVTNKLANIKVNEDAVKRVREAQWAVPQKFDYDTYNAGPRDRESAAPVGDENADYADGPTWAANAVKYEWSDDFGEVGPRHPALEQMLFRDEHIMEIGEKFER